MTDKTLNDSKMQKIYLDWVNNFTSTNGFADHLGITQPAACRLIDEGRAAHERIVAELDAAKAKLDADTKRLKNGAIEIARIEMHGSIYVAADTNGMAGADYATWVMDDEGNTFWGHYFEDEDEALDDLQYRAGLK